MASSAEQGKRSVDDIEADIAAARTRLAGTVDELAVRAQPKEIVRRQVASAKLKLDDVTRAPDGQIRIDRVGPALAAVAVLLLVMGLLRRRRS